MLCNEHTGDRLKISIFESQQIVHILVIITITAISYQQLISLWATNSIW